MASNENPKGISSPKPKKRNLPLSPSGKLDDTAHSKKRLKPSKMVEEVQSTGFLFVWGVCQERQLTPDSSEADKILIPRLLIGLTGRNVEKVACGLKHTVVLVENGVLFSFGSNEFKQLGSDQASIEPSQIVSLENQIIVDIECGHNHTLALNKLGKVYAWGRNTEGQLGRDDVNSSSVKLVQTLGDQCVVQLACGGRHSMALTLTSKLYGWGCNAEGQVGIGKKEECVKTPQEIVSLNGLPVRLICAGGSHSIVLTPSGSLYAWGSNEKGQLGVGELPDPLVLTPLLIKTLKSLGVVHVSCGEEHTAVLTHEGGVFTFGSGVNGQLGHNDRTSLYLPKKVFELMGSNVCQLVCGRMHTIALVPNLGRLYSFGSGCKGQLGTGKVDDCLGPTIVKGPWVPKGKLNSECKTLLRQESIDGIDKHVVRQIFTGGDYCVMLGYPTQSAKLPKDQRVWLSSTTNKIALFDEDLASKMEAHSSTEAFPKTIQDRIDAIFSSHACLSSSALAITEYNQPHMSLTRQQHGLNLDLAVTNQSLAISHLKNVPLGRLRMQLFDNVFKVPRDNYPDVECLRCFLFLAVSPLMEQTDSLVSIIVPYTAAVNRLSTVPSKVLDSWFGLIEGRHLRKLVKNMVDILTYILSIPPTNNTSVQRQEHASSVLEFLKRLNIVNRTANNKIPYTYFYLPKLQDLVNIESDFVNWLQLKYRNLTFNYCNYPFIYDGSAKSILLSLEAKQKMQEAMLQAHTNLFASMFTSNFSLIGTTGPIFQMEVSRNSIIQDAIIHLSAAGPGDLRKPLRIKFKGEEAVDEGGVIKEFFILIMREILNPIYGMFKINQESRMAWFNDSGKGIDVFMKTIPNLSLESDDIFKLVGQLCGLAIYHSILIDLAFPLALFKKLLGSSVNLDDLKELDPVVGQSMQQIIEYEGEDLSDVFQLTFQMTIQWYDEQKVIDLLPKLNNEPVMVTQANKLQYIDLYVAQVLNLNCESQYQAFHEGFHFVCGGTVLQLFQPLELQAMVVGSDMYNWSELRSGCQYGGEYWEKHPVIIWFWEVFHQMSDEEKKKFLRFLTGCDRVPIHGMKGLQIKIQPSGSDDNHLPAAHTCFNLLDLPKYSSKEIMQKKLILAIENTEGFGLV